MREASQVMAPDGDSYTITLKDVYNDLSGRLDKTTTDLNTRMDTLNVSIQQVNLTLARIDPLLTQTSDHEARIRVLERFRFTLLGYASALGIASGSLSDVIYHALHH